MQGGTYFPETRRMLLFHAPLILTHFWPASTLLRGHLALATLSLLVNDPQILERWGYAHECTWTNVTERGILVSNFGMTCNTLCEFHTLDWLRHVSALPENRLRRRHVLKYATQLSCIRKLTLPISLFQYSHRTFVIIRLRPFRRLFINLTMCEFALLPKTATILVFVEQAFWRMPSFTE